MLNAYDALHVLGSRVERSEWCLRFRPAVTHDSALIAWARFREGLRAHGVPARLDSPDVVVFLDGARAAIARMLPPIEADDDDLDGIEHEGAPAPRPRRASARELEASARATWSTALFATGGAFHRELSRVNPGLWAARERRAHDLFRRLEQEDRDRALGVRLTPGEAEIIDALREGPAASARELRDRLVARGSPWWASRAPVTMRVYIGRLRQRLRGGPLRLSERRLAFEACA